ncbi:hypothetical protein HDU96_000300 [Phlyctochytrium bullatum]|nr:hypothetical protein HDU96_000300 [Phlyctochytrium bullatum]
MMLPIALVASVLAATAIPPASAQAPALGFTMTEFLQRYATTPYQNDLMKRPLTFSNAAREVGNRVFGTGTLFVSSDDVYTANSLRSGGWSFISTDVVDYSIRVGGTEDWPEAKYHYVQLVDTERQISFIWDDFAPGRPLRPGQRFGNQYSGDGDRAIFIFSGAETQFTNCYLTGVANCTNGLVQFVSCPVVPAPKFTDAVRNRNAMGVRFDAWARLIDRLGWTNVIDNLPFNSITLFYPNNDALEAAGIPGTYTDEQLAKIVAWNIITDRVYPSSASPAVFSSPLFQAQGGTRTNDVSITFPDAGDVTFLGGMIRGVRNVSIPPSFEGTLGRIPGTEQLRIPGVSTSTSATSSEVATSDAAASSGTASAGSSAAPVSSSAAASSGGSAATPLPNSPAPVTTVKSGAGGVEVGLPIAMMTALLALAGAVFVV